LRHAREKMNASIYEAARETRIRVDFLQAMERDSFRFVSGTAYVRGMLRAYASWLELDDSEILEDFDRAHAKSVVSPVAEIIKRPVQPPPRPRERLWVIAAAVAASILLFLSLIGVMNPARTRVAAPPPPPTPTEEATEPDPSPSVVAQAPVPQRVELTVAITGDRCWMRVLEQLPNGTERPLFEGTLVNGQSRTFTAEQRIEVLFGRLHAVSIVLNGVEMGTPAGLGDTGTLVFYPDTKTFQRASEG